MSLADAINALGPALYWKLDEPLTATTVADSSGHGWTGTVSGDVGLGAFGPEIGTTAARLFTSGSITSAAWGLASWTSMSIMAMFTAAATVPSPSPAWFLGIGDIANPLIRGCVVGQAQSQVNQLVLNQRGSGLTNTGTVGFPQSTWHHMAWTYNNTTPNRLFYIDGQAGSSIAQNPGVAPVAGDHWWLNSPWPIVLAHFALFGRALTQTEVQTVSGQVQAWPYQLPINVPFQQGASAPVTISPTDPLTTQILANTQTMLPQTAQIPVIDTRTQSIQTTTNQIQTTTNAVHTDTQNIITTLFPQLETPLNYIQSTVTDILNGITTSITDTGGAVAQTLGDFFAQHSRDVFGVYNVTSGPTCSRIDHEVGLAAYWGLSVNITSWPSEWTFTTPADDWSIRDLAVLTITHSGEKVVRYGIHTKQFSLSPLPDTFPLSVSGVGVPVVPRGYHITVDWAGGVCGELLLQYLP